MNFESYAVLVIMLMISKSSIHMVEASTLKPDQDGIHYDFIFILQIYAFKCDFWSIIYIYYLQKYGVFIVAKGKYFFGFSEKETLAEKEQSNLQVYNCQLKE